MNILIVDNEPVLTQGIVKRIHSWKDIYADAVGAYSAQDALKIMEYFSPDLLITDVQMPGMDGLELIAQSLEQGLCRQFIVISAYELFQYAQRALQFGVVDYIVKPIDWEVLERHVRSVAMQPQVTSRLEQVKAQYPALQPICAKQVSPAFEKILSYLENHYDSNISLNQLSIVFDMSANYICSLFKKELDITYLDYIYHLRLQAAVEILLTQPDKTMKEIARMIGYQSERQFFRMFGNWMNTTPQQFRKTHSK